MAPATATGVPNPAAPSMNAPKAKAISSACRRAVAGEVADGVLEELELAALHRDAVEQDGGEDHPADGKESERRAVGDGGGEPAGGHAVDARRPPATAVAEPDQRGDPRRLAQHAEQQQQGENGQAGDQRGERQAAGDRCVVLLPHGGYPWMRRSLPAQKAFAQLALEDFAGAGFGQRGVA